MKYKNIIYMCIALIIVAFVLYRFIGSAPQINKTSNQPQVQSKLSTQTSEGTVTVIVTPKTLIPGVQAVFEIQFNTHSMELNYDVVKIASITDDIGNNLKAVSWAGGKVDIT